VEGELFNRKVDAALDDYFANFYEEPSDQFDRSKIDSIFVKYIGTLINQTVFLFLRRGKWKNGRRRDTKNVCGFRN
jgi:hypothetical protein